MADRNHYRPPRRSDTDFWAERPEEGDREGDQSTARNYDRDDMRRYARRSVEQGERLRRSRGEPQSSGAPSDPRSGQQRGGEGRDYGHQREWDQRELYRGYGTTISQRQGRDVDPDIERQRGREASGERDFPYDYEDFENEGDFYGNFYGESERRRAYGNERPAPGGYFSARGGSGGRSEPMGGGRYGSQGDRGMGGDPGGYGQESRDLGPGSRFDMDPGFAYEFGTRWDFDRDAGYSDRRSGQLHHDRGEQGRSRERYGRNQAEDWQIPGPYTGMGPRGYRPSDERIKDNLCEIFTRHGKIDARKVDIEVKEGNITLTGEVNRKMEKYLAEEIASSISGVNEVENRLRVKDR